MTDKPETRDAQHDLYLCEYATSVVWGYESRLALPYWITKAESTRIRAEAAEDLAAMRLKSLDVTNDYLKSSRQELDKLREVEYTLRNLKDSMCLMLNCDYNKAGGDAVVYAMLQSVETALEMIGNGKEGTE